MEGQLLDGRYRLLSRLGRGGMGDVWRARDERIGRAVAVKLLLQAGASQEALDRFDREAKIAGSLTSPAIVAIHDFGNAELEGRLTPYLVMELLTGTPLNARLADGAPVPMADLLAWGSAICDALEHAHAQGVVHRDIKPANVFLCADGRVKVLDFGIARFVETMPGGAAMTATGMMLGTPHYMSPEQVNGAKVDQRSDLYSLGCLLYAMVAGSPPFDADSIHGVALQHLVGTPVPPAPERSDVPDGLRALILQLLAKQPEERPQTAAEVRARLRNPGAAPAVSVAPIPPVAAPTPTPAPAPAARPLDPRDPRASWTPAGTSTPTPALPLAGHPTPGPMPSQPTRPLPSLTGLSALSAQRPGRVLAFAGAALVLVVALTVGAINLWPGGGSKGSSGDAARGGGHGSPAASASAVALPGTPEAAAASPAAMTLMGQIRATDPCAMLDRGFPRTFGSVVKVVPRQAEALSECQIVASNGGATDLSVRFRIDLGVDLSAAARVPLKPLTVGGKQLFEQLAAASDNNCTVFMPFGNTGFGASVEDNRYYPNRGSDQAGWADACSTAASYAALIEPTVLALNPRASAPTGRTLLGKDPCHALDADVLKVPGWTFGTVSYPGPYVCRITFTKNDTTYTLSMRFDRDAEQVADGSTPLRYGDITGIELPSTGSCTASLTYVHQTTDKAWDAQLIDADVDHPYSGAGSGSEQLDACGLANQAYKAVTDDLAANG